MFNTTIIQPSCMLPKLKSWTHVMRVTQTQNQHPSIIMDARLMNMIHSLMQAPNILSDQKRYI